MRHPVSGSEGARQRPPLPPSRHGGAGWPRQAGWRKGPPATKAGDRPPAAFMGLGAGRGLTSALLCSPQLPTQMPPVAGHQGIRPSRPHEGTALLPREAGASCGHPAALPRRCPTPLAAAPGRQLWLRWPPAVRRLLCLAAWLGALPLVTRRSWAQTPARHSRFCSRGLSACLSCQPLQHHLAGTLAGTRDHVPPSRPPTKLAQLFHLRASAQLRPWLPCSANPCLALVSGVNPPAWRAALRHSPTQCPGSGTPRGCPSRSGCRRSCRSSRTCWTCRCCICGGSLCRAGLSACLPGPAAASVLPPWTSLLGPRCLLRPIQQAPGRVVQPMTPMVPSLNQGREEGGESGGAACWVWPRGGSGRWSRRSTWTSLP